MSPQTEPEQPEHVDVLVIGAGLSGIGAACHLKRRLPGRSFAILEARGASGGTWDLFRYPGIRSDSDMFTLGYAFRPWQDGKSIADGGAILAYVRETAREYGIDRLIRYRQRVVHAAWSSATARWTVRVEHLDSAETSQLTCGFLYGNTGYYRYDEGYTPAFPGIEEFRGQVVHPQHWPAHLDYEGKRMVVIGSGATAVTLVPALAEKAEHVTMLQRSPTYVVALPAHDALAVALHKRFPSRVAAPIVRWKNVALTTLSFQLSRKAPKLMKGLLRRGAQRLLPAGYDVDTHFSPRYQPWDQRLCVVPDGDLFRSIRHGRVSVVTDAIETFTEKGVRLASGAELEADIVITATGLNLLLLGGIELEVDGRATDLADTVGYKGMMFSGVPNLAVTVGYTNASWTLKADLAAAWVCRLLKLMDDKGYRQVTPRAPDPAEPTAPFIDLTAGYVLRALDRLPKQGSRTPWRLHQNYAREVVLLRFGPIEDEALDFASEPGGRARSATSATVG
jgi:cation diffusion facilitator CzcD-associated flavoprotein CzcO